MGTTMSTMEHLRKQIQEIDSVIIQCLALRQNMCQQIAQLKQQDGKPITDINQEKKNFAFYETLAKSCALDPHFIEHLFRLIILNSRTVQHDTISERKDPEPRLQE